METAASRPAGGEARTEAVSLPVTVLAPPLWRLLRSGRDRAGTVAALLRRRWHRSVQLRVIATTLVISVAVVAVLGFFLVQQITSGLLASERRVALTQTSNGLIAAQGTLEGSRGGASSAQVLTSLAEELQAGSGPGEQYDVVILQNTDSSLAGVRGNRALAESLPQSLKNAVSAEQSQSRTDRLFYAPTRLVSIGGRAGPPALAVGAPISDSAQLYYLFPLTTQEGTIRLVQTALIGAGAALVVLLALIVSLVSRWVVVPIRQAARAASRLSAGDLSERMTVHGTDDLAALAESFNDMAASLEEKLRELQELSKVQRQFVSDVSHELRTPLTTIRIAADVLFEAKEDFDASASRSAELLQGQLERFEALLADLLEISRYDANVVTLDAESADICDLVRCASTDAEQLAARLGTRIEFRFPPEPCVAEVDRRRVERVLRNLLDNAVEHSEGRDVVATVAGDRDAVAVAVRDHGVGFAPGEQQMVFDRFWRSDPARARTTGGTGLGLAIALEDTRLHGGWLQAWGERGKGSVFRLTLPRVAGQELAGSPLPLGPDEAEVVLTVDPVLAIPGTPAALGTAVAGPGTGAGAGSAAAGQAAAGGAAAGGAAAGGAAAGGTPARGTDPGGAGRATAGRVTADDTGPGGGDGPGE